MLVPFINVGGWLVFEKALARVAFRLFVYPFLSGVAYKIGTNFLSVLVESQLYAF